MKRRIRIMIAKPGLDGHDRGAKFVARSLRDAGAEVIYTGIRQTPGAIAAAAVQEDVDFLGLSCLSGAHNRLFPEVVRLVRELGADDMVIFGGGVIPKKDWPALHEAGISYIFGPGTPMSEVISAIGENAPEDAALIP
ncbi:MAG TPA: cobalamin B12-binding domain-containing protein [Myxococcota bacterium]|nr:cobalamin B12-binding domain-containing protein [Myxococcota bacterium]HOD07550.1 cobalamin B12-binding domain-containing protein [Myxococcota bacterium]HPB49861.1 cobalamin B12-binding domain-containing protein [Myxococcota bacterium]HQP94854.1 cobalamin B12-binding domain-containing protein [Myxococcota bacterium]